jgi:ABC-type cobalamin/Fe3+-siderophores transport system ATPase subunit
VIRLSEVTLVRRDKPVLKNLSCSLPSDAVTGIVGPNGSGKSSLLRAIYGYLPRESGGVEIDQKALEDWSPEALAARLGVCPQEAEPSLDFRVDQALALPFGGRQEKMREKAEGLEFLRLPDLYDRHLSQLSGGERQRVRLGMALLRETPWLILDEPANHLDLATAWSLLEYLLRPRDGGVVMALHDLTTAARCCQNVLVLNQGEKVVQGDPRKVLTTEVLRDVFRLNGEFDWSAEPVNLKVSGVEIQ